AAPGLAAIAAVAALPGIALGLDRYRSLGHGVDAGALGIRSGSVVRRTVVLQRRALVGWQVRQSWFQRRSGLVTATALVGAGTGGYEVLDCGADQALHLIADASQAWARDLQPAGAPHESTYSVGGTRSAGAGS
ncbi:MAG: PH domain-containing protein, partial [Geodermatophilaceae bacterium]